MLISFFFLQNNFKLLCLNWSLIFYLKYSFCFFSHFFLCFAVFLLDHSFALFKLPSVSLCACPCPDAGFKPTELLSLHTSLEKWDPTDGSENWVELNITDVIFKKLLFTATQSLSIQKFWRKHFSAELVSQVWKRV